MADLMTTFSFALEVDGVLLGSFRKCSGGDAENDTIEYKEVTAEGQMIIRKVPGAMKWSDLTLERRIDGSKELSDWLRDVQNGDIDKARRNGSIIVRNSQKREVARWNFIAGWPSKWTGTDLDAGSNEIATEKVTITHEGLSRA